MYTLMVFDERVALDGAGELGNSRGGGLRWPSEVVLNRVKATRIMMLKLEQRRSHKKGEVRWLFVYILGKETSQTGWFWKQTSSWKQSRKIFSVQGRKDSLIRQKRWVCALTNEQSGDEKRSHLFVSLIVERIERVVYRYS